MCLVYAFLKGVTFYYPIIVTFISSRFHMFIGFDQGEVSYIFPLLEQSDGHLIDAEQVPAEWMDGLFNNFSLFLSC